MSPAPTSTPCALRRAVELVGPDREARVEMLDAEMAGDVEQHRPPDDAVAREMMDAEAARAARRRDEPGPVAVVERVVATDVPEAVELGRRLQRHDDVVVRHLILRTAATAAEHTVARGEVVEMQRLGAVAAGCRRTDRQREREALARPDECRGRRDALRRQQVGRPELILLAEPAPVVVRRRARRRRPCRAHRPGTRADPNRSNGTSGTSLTDAR